MSANRFRCPIVPSAIPHPPPKADGFAMHWNHDVYGAMRDPTIAFLLGVNGSPNATTALGTGRNTEPSRSSISQIPIAA